MAGISPSTSTGPYTANGVQVAYPFDFTANSESEVAVAVNGVEVSSLLYTVALNGDFNGGTITFLSAPANGAAILPFANPDFLQASEFESEGAYRLATVNTINRRSAVRDLWLKARVALLSPGGVESVANRVGKIFGWDAEGKPVFLTGTGSDAALRNDLAVSGGSALVGANDGASGTLFTNVYGFIAKLLSSAGAAIVGFINTGTGANKRTVQDRLRDTLNARDFGAIGDGFNHPLSERFGTLGAAQAVYPFVTALTQSLDWAGIQAALNEAARDTNRRGKVWLPVGYYILSTSLAMPSFVTLEGESRHGSVLLNQAVPLAAPQMVNKDTSSFTYVTVRNMSFFGGTHGMKVTVSGGSPEIAAITLENVSMVLQTDKSFEVNAQLQTARFVNCSFDGSDTASHGIYSPAGQNNANSWVGCDFLNFTDSHVYLDTGTGNTFIGCRFEGGGGAALDNKRTLQFNAMVGLSLIGCYFEKTHEYLMESANSTSPVLFQSCVFIGPVIGAVFQAYKWIANSTVLFSGNFFYVATTGPTTGAALGPNTNLTIALPTVASAATVTLPAGQSFIKISGTTTITSVTATPADAGRLVTLLFLGALTFTDGSNLKLASNYVTTADDTITIGCDGANWFETSRSAN